MLCVKDITKNYPSGAGEVRALRGVSVAFREKEFVSIIGPSGCGKTTLLNILGGLDRYTSGDLIIDGVSTKDFNDETWDAYRNSTVGFVFQNYNLISHLTIFENVEMTLKLSGYTKEECREKVEKSLSRVGMLDQVNKKPSELSGGQMQRVAIARALVNNPRIILADEPTGALDTELSEQIMSILKEVAKETLVVMVTHNDFLAEKYSDRMITMKDGEIIKDTMPYTYSVELVSDEKPTETCRCDKEDKKGRKKKTKTGKFSGSYMKLGTAFKLSLKNLVSKKRRTVLTSIAGSAGIIGLGLVLAFSNGINLFLESLQNSLLASIPVGIYEYSMDYSVMMDMFMTFRDKADDEIDFATGDTVNLVPASQSSGMMGDLVGQIVDSVQENYITEEFIEYMNGMNPEWYDAVYKYNGIQMNLVAKTDAGYKDVSPSEVETTVVNIAVNVLGEKGLEKKRWNQLVGDTAFMSKYYDLLEGRWPESKNDLVVVVNEHNELEIPVLEDFGFDIDSADKNGDGKISFSELLSDSSGFSMKLVTNDAYYRKTGKKITGYTVDEFERNEVGEDMYLSDGSVDLKIVGVLRIKKDSAIKAVGENLCYTKELSDYAFETATKSEVTKAQKALLAESGYKSGDATAKTVIKGMKQVTDRYIEKSITGIMFARLAKTAFMKSIGADSAPVYINVYAKDLKGKNAITKYIDKWNSSHGGQVSYFDVTEMFMYNVETITDISVYALLIVASVSLVVSSIMIGIITSNSVVERTREIGILRSMGARKRDILTVFLTETVLIGILSGIIGVALTYALAPLFSLLAKAFCGISNLAVVNPLYSLGLFALSIFLAAVSGLIPSVSASKKEVVETLRLD